MQQKSEGIFPRLFVRHDGAPNSRFSCCAAQIFPRGGEIFSLPVARWGATFCSFRGIGEGGTAAPLGFFAGAESPSTHQCEEGKALLCAPPMGGPTRPTPGVPFVSRRKEPKACQGLCPLEPRGGPTEKCFTFQSRSPCGARNPLDRVCATEKDRFATLSRWANRSYFFLWFYQGNTSCCQSVAW